MQDKDEQQADSVPSEIQAVIRAMVSAVHAVKLYPSNNPVYIQSVTKSYKIMEQALQLLPEIRVAVQKANFSYNRHPVGRDVNTFKGVVGDLFAKGIREILFTRGITEKELVDFYAVISLSQEQMKQNNGLASLVWEKGFTHVTIQEASLDEVVFAQEGSATIGEEHQAKAALSRKELEEQVKGKAIEVFQRRVMLVDIAADPSRFGAMMVEQVKQSGGTPEQQGERLFDAYRETGRQVIKTLPQNRDALFSAMAESVLSLEPPYKEGLIAGKLYVELDRQSIQQQKTDLLDHLPYGLHEVVSGRFSRLWTVPQVSSLLMKASQQVPAPGREAEDTALPAELYALAREMAEYTPEEMEALKTIAEYGGEADVIEATVRTLIYILPHAHSPFLAMNPEKEQSLFAGIVRHLEDLLSLLLNKKDYVLAELVLRALRIPVDPVLRPRLAEALKKAGGRKMISRVIDDIRTFRADSPEYQAVYSYLSLLDREATPVLLEILAEEEDRTVRKQLITVLKGLGKNQLALLGEKLSDERWYFVRNIVSILGESRKDEVVAYLEKVTEHKNFQIRQEVVRALIAIGGKKAAELLTRFLNDKDIDIQFMAIRGLGTLPGAGDPEALSLITFLGTGALKGISHELKKEAIESIGRIGGTGSSGFLRKYTKVKWWRPRKPQEELSIAARQAIDAIERRRKDAGRA